MYLDAANKITETSILETNGYHKSREVFEKWREWHPSQISHHSRICCEIAREWIAGIDFSEMGGSSIYTGPRWLRQRFRWGASTFPIYWCEIVRKKTLDCGALAALAHELFTVRGVKSYRVQLVQRFSAVATNQWSCSWSADGDAPLEWIENDLIYHEGCAIAVTEGEIKVWDASAGWWIDPRYRDGYGALLAIRLSADDPDEQLKWGEYVIEANRWQKMDRIRQREAAA